MKDHKVDKLRIVEYHIQNAFPNSKVRVFSRESPSNPNVIEYSAYVDNVGAYVTAMKNRYYSVTEISSELIYLIDEQRRADE